MHLIGCYVDFYLRLPRIIMWCPGEDEASQGRRVCVCVCVCERERERESVCVCVCVCVCARARARVWGHLCMHLSVRAPSLLLLSPHSTPLLGCWGEKRQSSHILVGGWWWTDKTLWRWVGVLGKFYKYWAVCACGGGGGGQNVWITSISITITALLPLGVATFIILIILQLFMHYLCASTPLAFSASLTRNGRGVFNVRSGLSVCCAREGVRSAEESAHVLTWKGQRDPSPSLDLEWNPGLGGVTLIILQTIPPTRCHLGWS